MSRQIDVAGKSGARYRYAPLDEDRFLAPSGANYLIGEDSEDGLKIIYAGETENLSNRPWQAALDEARRDRAAAYILTRLNVTRSIRVSEQADIVAQHAPPMNPNPAADNASAEGEGEP
ncbi:hypothetical protein [Phenylobacterium immobile]|uniref:hypothetical protein n=1 Tax=Phenylobacterium immobile TaxID=21 RepID=UPI000AFBDE63|nr:hypothetical protein [Phenylobacterium immobile]